MIYKVQSIINGQPTFSFPMNLILSELEIGGALKILSPLEYHTDRQRAWYRGVAVPALAEQLALSIEEADHLLKAACGGDDILKREMIYVGKLSNGQPVCHERMTIVGVGKKNMSIFIDNILAEAVTHEWRIQPPEPELRRT